VNGTGRARALLEHELEKYAMYVAKEGEQDGSFNMVTKALAALEAREGNLAIARGLYEKAVNRGDADAPKVLHQWAMWEQRVGNVEETRQLLQKAVDLDPTDTAILRALGELEMREGNFAKARSSFAEAVSLRPKDSRLWLAWGRSEHAAGDEARAEELFKSAASEEGSSDAHGLQSAQASRHMRRTRCEALCEAAQLAVCDGRPEEAKESLERGLELDPSYSHGWRLLADLSESLGGPEEMRAVYARATKSAPRSSRTNLFHWWGRAERKLGRFDDARRYFKIATERDSTYMSAWLSWGLLEKDQGNTDEACALFAKAANYAVADHIKAPFLFISWAHLEEQSRSNPDNARKIYQKGLTVCPKSPEIIHGLGLLEERQGRFERAVELYERGSTLIPTFGAIFQSWGLLEARRRRYKEAAEIFEIGTAKDPNNPVLWTSWALVEGRQRRNVGRARELFERAVAADRNFSGAWHAWGALENEVQNFDDARKYYTRAAECDPNGAAPHHSLGVLEGRRGDLPAARTHFNTAIEKCSFHAISYQAWALLEERMGSGPTEARRIFELGTQQCEGGPGHIWQAWALFEDRNGDSDRAKSIFEAGVARSPNNQTLHQTFAIFEAERGNTTHARDLFERGVRICPRDSASVYTAWAQFEAADGKLERARELFNLGLLLNPSHIPGWKAWASIEEAAGDFQRARDLRLTAKGLIAGSQADLARSTNELPTVLESINRLDDVDIQP